MLDVTMQRLGHPNGFHGSLKPRAHPGTNQATGIPVTVEENYSVAAKPAVARTARRFPRSVLTNRSPAAGDQASLQVATMGYRSRLSRIYLLSEWRIRLRFCDVVDRPNHMYYRCVARDWPRLRSRMREERCERSHPSLLWRRGDPSGGWGSFERDKIELWLPSSCSIWGYRPARDVFEGLHLCFDASFIWLDASRS